mmetsp:Transcript_11510/g.22066  ORF Transcript_11510/g.22066 Transcript_11510/m.22066 type:complete len:89 (-) Transcript_11510:476-742(-)
MTDEKIKVASKATRWTLLLRASSKSSVWLRCTAPQSVILISIGSRLATDEDDDDDAANVHPRPLPKKNQLAIHSHPFEIPTERTKKLE